MIDTSKIDGKGDIQDLVFGTSYLTLIIKERANVYVQERYQNELQLFTQFYWERVKGYGRYLKDVDFRDLSADCKEDLVYDAFILWRNYMVETGKMV